MRKTYGPYLSGGYRVFIEKEGGKIVDCIFEHQKVAEEQLGRLLRGDEVIHHLDGDKTNNDPANLVVITVSQHLALHGRKGRTMLDLVCDQCSKPFQREKGQSKGSKGYRFNYCSRSCSAPPSAARWPPPGCRAPCSRRSMPPNTLTCASRPRTAKCGPP